MSIEVSVENIEEAKARLRGTGKSINGALSRAVNRAATNAKANMAKVAREKYVVTATAVKSTVDITKATAQNPIARVRSTGGKISLAKFQVSPPAPRPKNPPQQGYKVRVKRGGELKAIPRAFLVELNGSLAMMQRQGSARLPITKLMGPSIPEMIGSRNSITWLEDEARKTLNSRFDHEIERVLEVSKK